MHFKNLITERYHKCVRLRYPRPTMNSITASHRLNLKIFRYTSFQHTFNDLIWDWDKLWRWFHVSHIQQRINMIGTVRSRNDPCSTNWMQVNLLLCQNLNCFKFDIWDIYEHKQTNSLIQLHFASFKRPWSLSHLPNAHFNKLTSKQLLLTTFHFVIGTSTNLHISSGIDKNVDRLHVLGYFYAPSGMPEVVMVTDSHHIIRNLTCRTKFTDAFAPTSLWH
jgi:hypothetical protein